MIMKCKYLKDNYVEGNFRSKKKDFKSFSNVSKALIIATLLIVKWTGWAIRNGGNPWIGSNGNYKFTVPLLSKLHSPGKLQDVASPSLGWTKEWKFEFELGLDGDQALEWTHFITQLKHSAIRFIDQEDELTWTRCPTTSILTTKVGYKAKMEETRQSIKD